MSESKERFEILFENNPHPTWVYDVETLRFLEVNRAAIRDYGYSRAEFLSMRITDIRPQGDVSDLLEELKKGRPEIKASERRYLTKAGRVFPVAVTSHLAELHGRKVAVVVSEDISARKEAHEMLIRAKEEAERATRFKDQFLSTMSHELRTPLNAVLGFSELLTDEVCGALNARQRRYVDHIHQSGKHLLRLINDILDLSRIEAGRFELTIETISVRSVFYEVLSTVGPLAERKSQTVTQNGDDVLRVCADVTRLKQILLNLLGNAIKFTPQGGHIELLASVENGQARIAVQDSGPGIAPEEQKRIFEAFYRLRTRGEATEGTGLGLAISQRLVQLHGSELAIHSVEGKGCCFYFYLPLAALPETYQLREVDGAEIAHAVKARPQILIAEDDLATCQLIESQLAAFGYDVVSCREPKRVHELAVNMRPDAIILDVLMRPLNGWEVLVGLKSDKRTEQIPVIMMTFVDQPGMGTILGADEFLVKPVQKDVLLEAVERCLRNRGVSLPSRQILVIEDDPAAREMIVEMLHSRGFEVQTASDGLEARLTVADSLPALVILDLLLPKVGGFELIAEWRANSRTADLPIFVLTSKDLSADEAKYLRANSEFLMQKQSSWHDALLKQLHRTVPGQQPVETT
jgi:PAS domain S-box-containing protein